MVNYNCNKSLPGIGLDVALTLFIIFTLTAPLATILHYLYFPETPIYLITLLPPEWGRHPIIYWGYAVIPTFYAYVGWQTTLVIFLLAFVWLCKSKYLWVRYTTNHS